MASAPPACTGDVRGAAEALLSLLRAIRCDPLPPAAALEAGDPAALLPALHHALLRFSKHVATLAADSSFCLAGKTDARFAEAALRFAREALRVRPGLTAAQLLAPEGFAERKLLLVAAIVRACREHHNAAARQDRLAGLRAANAAQRLFNGAAPAQPVVAASAGSAGRAKPKPALLPSAVKVVPAVQPVEQQQQEEQGQEQRQQNIADGAGLVAAHAKQQAAGFMHSSCDRSPTPQPAAPPAAASKVAAPSPADQPRLLPPSIAAQKLQQTYAVQQQQQQQPRWQPEQLGMAPPPAQHATVSFLQLVRPAALPPQLPLSQQWPPPQPAALALEPPLPPAQQQQQHLAAYPAMAAAPAGAPPAVATAAAPSTALACLASPPADASGSGVEQTRQLIEQLQLRLQLAEEAAAAARQEGRWEREQMQARLAVLEGRVKFLEAGADMLALPWAPSSAGSPLKLLPPPLPARVPAPQAPAPALYAHPEAVAPAYPAAARWQQPVAVPSAAQQQQRPSARAQLNPLFEQQRWPPPAQAAAPTCSWADGRRAAQAAAPLVPASGSPGAGGLSAAAVPAGSPGAATAEGVASPHVVGSTAAAAGGGAGRGGGGGVGSLISSMRGRLSDADELLRSLGRR